MFKLFFCLFDLSGQPNDLTLCCTYKLNIIQPLRLIHLMPESHSVNLVQVLYEAHSVSDVHTFPEAHSALSVAGSDHLGSQGRYLGSSIIPGRVA